MLTVNVYRVYTRTKFLGLSERTRKQFPTLSWRDIKTASLYCFRFRRFIGCLHDRANIELAQAGLLEPRPLAQM